MLALGRTTKAIPATTMMSLATSYRFMATHSAVADLIIIAFFFLLRVGEYTAQASNQKDKKKRTIPLRTGDIKLWSGRTLIDHTASLQVLLAATSATICIENTKNGTKNAVLHHVAIGGPMCPVATLARRVYQVRQIDSSGTAPIGTVHTRHGQRGTVSDRMINTAVRWGAVADGLLAQGYTLTRISSHSLRAGGAMALKLNGYDETVIMKAGRWTSQTFLTYIHTQIAALSEGLSAAMVTQILFHNVG